MLFDNKNYKDLVFTDFLKLLYENGGSLLHGDYEYFFVFDDSSNNHFGHYSDIVKLNIYHETGPSYSGHVDAFGYAKLEKDSDGYTSHHTCVLQKRDISSLEDEMLRYAEYCRYYASCINEYCKYQTIHNGKHVSSEILQAHEAIKNIDFERLNNDPKYAISTRQTAKKAYQILNFPQPWLNGNYIWYTFFSKIVGPKEEELTKEYKTKKKKFDNTYWYQREQLHFDYLDTLVYQVSFKHLSMKDQDVIIDYLKPKKEIATSTKKNTKPLWLILCVIGILFSIMAFIGLPAAIKESFSHPKTSDYVFVYVGTAAVFSPFYIIFLILLLKKKNDAAVKVDKMKEFIETGDSFEIYIN